MHGYSFAEGYLGDDCGACITWYLVFYFQSFEAKAASLMENEDEYIYMIIVLMIFGWFFQGKI